MKIKDLKVGDFFIHPQSTSSPKCICLAEQSRISIPYKTVPYVVVVPDTPNMRGAVSCFDMEQELEQEVEKLNLNDSSDMVSLIVAIAERQAIDMENGN